MCMGFAEKAQVYITQMLSQNWLNEDSIALRSLRRADGLTFTGNTTCSRSVSNALTYGVLGPVVQTEQSGKLTSKGANNVSG